MVYIAGLDNSPIKSEVRRQGDLLSVEKSNGDSGKVFFPYKTAHDHLLLLPTGTVIERERPFRIALEMARGTVNRLRNQLDLWQRFGFEFDPDLDQAVTDVSKLFCEAAAHQDRASDCDAKSVAVIDRALDVITSVCLQYEQQVVEIRQEQTTQLPTLVAGRVPDAEVSSIADLNFAELFNAAYVPVNWSQCEPIPGRYEFKALKQQLQDLIEKRVRIILGPIVRLDDELIPHTIMQSQDFELVRRRLKQFVEALILETRDWVDIFEVFGGVNSVTDPKLPIDFQLRLTIDAIEAARQADSETPMLIGFDQPWCEGSIRDECISPLQCADAVVRADLDLSGFTVEMNWGPWPSGSSPRDWLQVHWMLDRWSEFELPIVISMSIPAGNSDDPLARETDMSVDEGSDSQAAARQSEALESLLQLFLSKPFVQGIVWNQLSDKFPHVYRNSGLFDAEHNAKDAVETWVNVRQKYLT